MENRVEILRRLSEPERQAIILMGIETDTLEGFDINHSVMQKLRTKQLVNVDDTGRFRKFWLNRDGLALLELIRAELRNFTTVNRNNVVP